MLRHCFFYYVLNNKYTYLYDLSGNLLKKTLINLTNNDIIKEYNYSYTNSNWEDQLTIYDGNNITYDSWGNVISIKVGFNIDVSWLPGYKNQ